MHCKKRPWRIGAALPVLAYLLSAAAADAFEPVNAPVTIKVSPEVALLKGSVTLSGTSLVVGKNKEVTLEVTAVGGSKLPARVLKASMDASGNFQTQLNVDAQDKFQVKAIAPDGKGSATATF